VRGGKGLVGLHAATDNFYDWPEGIHMMGGVFAGHPWGAGGTWAFALEDPKHPLNRAFDGKGFKVSDEIYQFNFYSRTNLHVLVKLDMDDAATARPRGNRADKDHAVSWVRREGAGRVFYYSLGHNHPIFWNPPLMQHLLDGIQYALGDLKADDAPSAK
jgi:type 1 glutamine amidotransferase